MSRIRGKNTKPELWLRRALWAEGVRYRLGNKIIGRPDVVFKTVKVAVFVDGCFWHKCPLHGVMPKQNKEFWRTKILGNVRHDRLVRMRLKHDGWQVLRFWEHEIEANLTTVVARIRRALIRFS